MRATILPQGHHTDQGPQGRGQYYGQGVYCGLSTASEVFIIFFYPTISYLCNYNAIYSLGKYCNRNTPNPQYFPLLISGG